TPRSARTTSCSRKSMTARVARKKSLSIALAAVSALVAAAAIGCGTSYYEIPIETPIQPKMDVSPFQRVLVAGFVAGGTEDVDANQETVRLLRSQLRTKSQLKVIDADLLPLMDVAGESSGSQTTPAAPAGQPGGEGSANGSAPVVAPAKPVPGVSLPQQIK